MIGTNAFVTNQFFLREDVVCPHLPEVTAASCFFHPRAAFGREQRFLGIKDGPWERV